MTALHRLPPPVVALLAFVLVALVAGRASAETRWNWPIVGAISRGFERPASAWGAGHRGVDIVAAPGATIRAPVSGTVTFVGPVAGRGVIVISTLYDENVTLEPVDATVIEHDIVEAGTIVGILRAGHDGGTTLHLGARVHGAYVDPMTLLPPKPRVVIYDSRVISW